MLAGATVVLALVLAGCGDRDSSTAATAHAAEGPADELPDGRIAFRRFLGDDRTQGAIFVMRIDGSGERQLTDPQDGATDDYPDWSPDGRLIAFQRCRPDGPCSVWTVGADGGEAQQVRFQCGHKGDCDAAEPTWTHDGDLIVTLAEGRVRELDGQPQIQQSGLVRKDLATGEQQSITKLTGWKGDLLSATVSPDDRTVVYQRLNSARSRPAFGQALFAVDMSGRHERRIASWELGGGDHAVFSPSGSVLFRSYANDDSRQSDFWTVRPDGSDLRQLTHFDEGTLVLSASYSPDGEWIVHASNGVGGNADLFVMHADGTGNRPLTHTQAWDSAPDWGPPSP
jgi:Tol biopolymer transport system component